MSKNKNLEAGKDYILLDTPFFKFASVPIRFYANEADMEKSPLFAANIELNNFSFLRIFDDLMRELGVKAVLPEEIIIEKQGMNFSGYTYHRKDFIKGKVPNYNEVKDFVIAANDGTYQNIICLEATHQEVIKVKNDIDKISWAIKSRGETHRTTKGKQAGDSVIGNIIDENPESIFYVITSDCALGIDVNKKPNASAMNFCGFFSTLSEGGILTKIGFKEKHKLPSGNDVINFFSGMGYARDRYVTNSSKFEECFREKGILYFPKRRLTEFTSFEDYPKIRTNTVHDGYTP